MKSLTVIAAVVLFVSSLTNAFAQNAVVTGTVADATGALIPGVEVTATNVNTGIVTTAVSNESGAYNFQSLQPGTYRLTASLPGFQTAAYNDVRLGQTQQARFNFMLQVGGLATEVEVTADADLILATTSASVGNVLPEREVNSLPLSTRNVLDLFQIMSGTGGTTGQGTGSNGGIGENFAGQRITEINTTRDGLVTSSPRFLMSSGVETATFISPDLVEEVQVITGSIDAEAGRGPGQIRLQTRSGTNEFHGALFYTNNNKALNANNWFSNRNSVIVPWTNRNQFGGRLGGPILKNKAFFFVLIESGRYLEKQSFVANVLTKEARQGIFRYLTAGAPAGQPGAVGRQNGNANSLTPSVDKNGTVLASAGGQLFLNSGNLFAINPDRTRLSTSPWLLNLLSKMPEPNDFTVGDGLNTAGFRWARPVSGLADPRSTSTNTNRDTLNARFDYQVNEANKLSFIMTREKNWAHQSNIAAYPTGTNGPLLTFPNLYSGTWTATISPTMLNEFRLGRQQEYLVDRPPQFEGWDGKSLDTIDAAKLDTLPQPNGYLLQVTPTNFPLLAPFNSASLRDVKSPRYQVSDTLSWTRGSHAFKAGGEWMAYWANGWSTLGGAVPFTSFGQGGSPVTTAQVSSGFPNLAAGDVSRTQSILNDLTGSVASLTQLFFINSPTQANWQDYKDDFRRRRNFRQDDWSLFFKDTWQATRDLTLTLGLRYDKYGVVFEQAGLAPRTKGGQGGIFGISGTDFSSWFVPGASRGALTEIEFVGQNSPNPNRGMYKNDWNNVAPSLGFSWSVPWFNRRTVVRGGYGVNYSGAGSMFLYETCCGRSPGSTLTVQSIPTTYQSLTTISLPLTPPVPPYGIVPLTDRVSAFGTFSDETRTPYVQNWNVSITRELGRSLTLSASYIGNKAVKLYQPIELNEPNIQASWPAFSNETFIQAFNATRAGGQSTMFDRMLMGIDLDGTGALPAVNGTTATGSSVLRRFAQSQGFIARGEVAGLAQWINSTTAGNAAGDLTTGNLIRKNGFPENFLVVNPQFGSAQLWGNNNESNYHSLQVQLTRRLTSGFSSQFTYTWAKAMGHYLWSGAPGDGNSGATAATTLDPRNRNADHGRLSFDRKHTINANGTWALPFGSNKLFLSGAPKWIDRIVGDWELSGILSVGSGYPRDVNASLKTVGAASNANYANVVGDFPRATGRVTVGDRVVNYFADYKAVDVLPAAAGPARDAAIANLFGADWNTLSAAAQTEMRTLASAIGNYKNIVDGSGNAVLTNPGSGQVGNLSTGWVDTPGRFGLDIAAMKRVQITEGMRFTIRADAINVLNKPQWGAPITDINNQDFGLITGASGSRTITINARIDF